HGGYKPTGRGKPASEYLVRAAGDGGLRSINLAVDACNAVSLHSGIPISLIDVDKARPPLRVAIAAADARYIFNASGQEIRLGGLLCLHDIAGPCANAVKDAQRTKTDDDTRHALAILWGHRDLAERVSAAERWYREIVERAGASAADVPVRPEKRN
ncbi:MAG: phenylalanine--tRNA ligase beta subunit-related protein, partial [Myxococcota bacterium]